MNEVVLAKFTPQVLRGAERLGMHAKALSAFLRVSERHISRMSCGLAALSVRHARMLERKTQRSASELAVLGVEQDATPAQRIRHSAVIRETLALLAGIDASDSRPVPARAPHRRAKPPASTRKRASGTRARAA